MDAGQLSYVELIGNLKKKIEQERKEEITQATMEELPHLIAALPSILTGYDVFSDKVTQREDLKEYLEKRFSITDKKSAIEQIRMFVFENTQLQFEQLKGFWEGKPSFDTKDMKENTREYFEKCKTFAEQFYPIVKDKGFAAFDFGEGIRMAKECYSAGYLEDDDYQFMLKDLGQRAFRMYDGFEDYAISYLCGGTYFMYYTSGASQEYADHMFQTLFGGISELFFKGEQLWNHHVWPEVKKYFKEIKEVKKLIEDQKGCLVTDRISLEQAPIQYMVRQEPSEGNPDSGWQFFAGDESPEYLADMNHVQVFALNTVCNYDPSIIPLLDHPVGSAFIRKQDGSFEKVEK